MDNISVIKAPIEEELKRFRYLYDSTLTTSNPLLNEVLEHLKQRNGKMMRPILVLLSSKLFGYTDTITLHGAVALELLHTASLIHDDVVDESNLRRGQPSVNASFNNKVAVLSGDYLLASCLVVAAKTKDADIVNVLSNLGKELSEGELLQLSNINNAVFSENIYFDVIKKKTAALFAACTKIGALSVSASREECEFARQLGEYIGICFQIKDDIFDYYSDERIGKPTGNDMEEGKLTLPAIYALNSTDNEWVKKIASKVKNRTATDEEISELIEFAKENGGIEYAVNKISEYKEKALEMLDTLPASSVRESLKTFIYYVVDREK